MPFFDNYLTQYTYEILQHLTGGSAASTGNYVAVLSNEMLLTFTNSNKAIDLRPVLLRIGEWMTLDATAIQTQIKSYFASLGTDVVVCKLNSDEYIVYLLHVPLDSYRFGTDRGFVEFTLQEMF